MAASNAAALPAVVLTIVACGQVVLARLEGLSPWKGGGFGMFSTTDDAGRRDVRIFVTAPGRSEELAIPPSLQEAARRAAIHPSDRQLARLARRVVERERRAARDVSEVRLECSRIAYAAGTLSASTVPIRVFTYRTDAPR
jgi:hypothetical protein